MKKITALFMFLHFVSPGQTTFQKAYGSPGVEDINAMIKTADNGYIMAGYTSYNGYNAYVVKTDSNGLVRWTKTYDGGKIESAYDIASTDDGGYIMTGYAQTGNPPTGNRAMLLKIDSGGSILWTKNYGLNYEGGNSVIQTSDKGYFVTGYTGSSSSSSHFYIFKTDSAGSLQWTKKLNGGGCCGNGGSGVQAIKSSDENTIVMGQEYYSLANNTPLYLAKYGTVSTPIWETYFFSPSGGTLGGNSIKQTSDKGFIIAGQLIGGAFLLKVDSMGASQWINKYAWNNCGASSVIETADGGFAFTGNKYSTRNIFLCKTNSAGSLQWSMAYGDTTKYTSISVSLVQNADKGFTIAGKASYNTNNSDFYLIKTDSLGKSYCNEFTIAPVETSLNLVGFGGYNKDSLGVDSVIVFQKNNISDTTTVFCYNNARVNEFRKEHGSAVFPNPFSYQTVLKITDQIDNGTLHMYNSKGQTAREIKNVRGAEIIFRRDNLPPGLYFLRLTESGKVIAEEKMIITGD